MNLVIVVLILFGFIYSEDSAPGSVLTISAGLFTVKSPYFIDITKNIKIKNNISFFLSSGMTPLNYLDVDASPYAYSSGLSYNQDKMIFSFSVMKVNSRKQLYTSFSLAHQWELIPYMPNVFLSLGIGKFYYYKSENNAYSLSRPYSILSVDYRF